MDLYVSPEGSDAWSGRMPRPNAAGSDGPLATLDAARRAVQRIKAKCADEPRPITVGLADGVYETTEPIRFTHEDSGSARMPIVYRALPGARPVISGGRALSGWQVSDDGAWTLEIPEVRAGDWVFSHLWVNGRRAEPARLPAKGSYYRTAGKAFEQADGEEEPQPSRRAFRFSPGDIRRFHNLEDAVVVVHHAWETSAHRIAQLDESEGVVTFTGDAAWAFEQWEPRQRYFIQHIREGLTEPGQWYLDRRAGVLYYRPLEGETPATARVFAPAPSQLLLVAGDAAAGEFVDYLHFNGIAFEHTDYTIPPESFSMSQAARDVSATVEVCGARHCLFEDCRITHTGNYALWLRDGARHNRVQRCEMADLGAGGPRIGEIDFAEDDELRSGHNTIDNCFIHGGGRMFPGAVGVWIGHSSQNRITHNEIADFYYTGVSVGWTWGYRQSTAHHNAIEYNHIHHIGQGVLSDMGGIYTLGIAPGTVLRGNHIHDVIAYGYGGWGIYPDEGSSYLLIEDNVCHHTKTGGFHQHYGRENVVRNNIFAFSVWGQLQRTREEPHVSFFFEQNAVLVEEEPVLHGNWSGEVVLDRNLYWDVRDRKPDFGPCTFEEWQKLGQDKNSIIADPRFADPRSGDFRLFAESPLTDLGFRPIDVSNAGLYGPDAWTRKPRSLSIAPPEPVENPLTLPIEEGFDEMPEGLPPMFAAVHQEPERGGTVRVASAPERNGRCLLFQDAAGLEHAHNPHISYEPREREGRASIAFDLRMEKGAYFWHEWRDSRRPYRAGPSLRIADGRLRAAGRDLAAAPIDTWFRVTVECGLGVSADGLFSVRLEAPGRDPLVFENLPLASPEFRSLRWFGFVAMADAPARFYLDNLSASVR